MAVKMAYERARTIMNINKHNQTVMRSCRVMQNSHQKFMHQSLQPGYGQYFRSLVLLHEVIQHGLPL